MRNTHMNMLLWMRKCEKKNGLDDMVKAPDERVNPKYPAQEGEVGCNDGAKLTCDMRKEMESV